MESGQVQKCSHLDEIKLLRTELKNLRNQIRGLRAQHQKDIVKLQKVLSNPCQIEDCKTNDDYKG